MNSSDELGTMAVPAIEVRKPSKITAGHQSVAHGAGDLDGVRRV
jgi:hypothetical protein